MKIYINRDGEITNDNGEDMKVCELCQAVFNPKDTNETSWTSSDSTICQECLDNIPY